MRAEMSTPITVPHRLSFHIAWISVVFGSLLVLPLVLCASWMAREINTAAINEQKSAVAANLRDMGRRTQLQQGVASARVDGVFYSTHGRFAWVPTGLAQWLSQQ